MHGIDVKGDPHTTVAAPSQPAREGLSASADRDASAARIVGVATALERLCPRAVPTFSSPAVYMGRYGYIIVHRTPAVLPGFVCGHESLEMRTYLGVDSEGKYCCCCPPEFLRSAKKPGAIPALSF